MRFRRGALGLTSLVSLALALHGQSGFEVASVRANKSSDPPTSRFPLGPGGAFVPGSLFFASNQPLIAYLRFAYKLGAGDLLNLPGWVYTDGFDIEARAPGNPTKDKMRTMMRALLADRFNLRSHMEPRNRPVFDLTFAGKNGPMLVPDLPGGCSPDRAIEPRLALPSIPCGTLGPLPGVAPGTGRLGGRGVTIAQIASILSNPFTGIDRPVRDRTGLKGTFDFSLEWSVAQARAQIPDAGQQSVAPDDSGAPAFREALQKQLGLKLTSATGSVDVLVIDRLERPQQN